MDEDDLIFYRDRISDAWADIRAYGSDLWRIMALTVAASAVLVHMILSPNATGSLMFFDFTGWIGLCILSGFTFFSSITTWWISNAIAERVQMVDALTTKVTKERIPLYGRILTKKSRHKISISMAEIKAVLMWMPTGYILRFSGLMWAVSVVSWYVQVLLAFYSDWITLALLFGLQTFAFSVMAWLLKRQQLPLSW